jgi:hypothetical protein
VLGCALTQVNYFDKTWRLECTELDENTRTALVFRAMTSRIFLCLFCSVVFSACAPVASHEEAIEALTTHRVAVSGGVMVLGAAPNGSSQEGLYIAATKPVWMSARNSIGQYELSPSLVLGGTSASTVMATTSFTIGGHLYVFPALSFEAFIGPALGLQLGGAGLTPTLGLQGHGGWIFHPFEDHRQRVKLEFWMSPMASFRTTTSDCPLCSGFLGIGLAYETTY